MNHEHIITLQRMLEARKAKKVQQEKFFNESSKLIELHSEDKVYVATQRWFMQAVVRRIAELTPEIEALEAVLASYKVKYPTTDSLTPAEEKRASQAVKMSDADAV